MADQAIQRFSKIVHSGIDQLLVFQQTLSPDQRTKLVAEVREQQDRMKAFQDKGDKFQKIDKKNNSQKPFQQ